MLEIKNLVKSYGNGERVLKGLNFSTGDKKLTAIIGSSGAGKSTMLRCINRLVTADSGEILLDGVDLLKLRGKSLQNARRQIGMIFQDPISSLNPVATVEKQIVEVLMTHTELGRGQARVRAQSTNSGRRGVTASGAARKQRSPRWRNHSLRAKPPRFVCTPWSETTITTSVR